ncbi:MAG: hypothetical protein Kow0058_15070 [Roseovarius sp.]
MNDMRPLPPIRYNLIRPAGYDGLLDPDLRDAIMNDLVRDGWTLLRGFDVDVGIFSALVGSLCARISLDPAREHSAENTQKVDAGLGPIGLHIENGNTPRCPDLVAFYCRTAAFEGSQTTICDGARMLEAMPDALRERWSQKMTVSRRLPERLWKRYLANEHPALSDPAQVTMAHVLEFKAAVPGQDFELHADGTLSYFLTLDPIRASRFSGVLGFANAVLGPSINYEPPRYRLADGSWVGQAEIDALAAIAESCTHEINWQDGDVAILDNTRVMHGRRAIIDANRELFIGMGSI